jgi:hypothetical protein
MLPAGQRRLPHGLDRIAAETPLEGTAMASQSSHGEEFFETTASESQARAEAVSNPTFCVALRITTGLELHDSTNSRRRADCIAASCGDVSDFTYIGDRAAVAS